MKKIFSKFTRERDPRFQIETSIYLENGEKFAAKRPLSEASAAHVAALYENYRYFRENGVELFVPCEPFGDGVRFPFIKGVTYYTQILEAVEAGNRNKFDELIEEYKKLVELSCAGEAEAFAPTEEFTAIFGNQEILAGKKAYRKLDIDLTFDNLILTPEGDNKVIDYEWMFDFSMPLEFVYYRAALALYVRNGAGMNAFISEAELFAKFGLGEKEQEVYSLMNEAFNDYTAGGELAFVKAQKKYAKKAYVLSEWMKQSSGIVQVYVSKDASFRISRCLDFEAEENVELQIELGEFTDTHVIRLDPLNVPGTIHQLRMSYTQENVSSEIEPLSLRHNASMVYNGSYVFTGEDPQIIWDIPAGKKPETLHISYSIGEDEDGMRLMHAQLEELKEKEKKLAYIEGTKAYKMFLEKKVSTVFGGES